MTAQLFVVGVVGSERVSAGELVAAARSWFGLAGAPASVVAVESEMTRPVTIEDWGEAPDPLTPRQKQVLLAVAATDRSMKEIADELGISVQTARNHLVAGYAKLGVRDRRQAMLRAIQLGLVVVEREVPA